MILGIQILGVIFGLLMAYLCFLHYKRREFGGIQFLFWEILWIGFIFVIIFPKITNILVQELSITRAMDFFIILGFMFITSLTFYNYVTISKIKRRLEEEVRRDALKSLDNKS